MRDKKALLFVDQVQYIYSIKVSAYVIKIIVYLSSEKVPLFTAYMNYIESWGFDVYRPKMIEMLIRYYLKNSGTWSGREIILWEHPELFEALLDVFFQDTDEWTRTDFAEKCRNRYQISKNGAQRTFA